MQKHNYHLPVNGFQSIFVKSMIINPTFFNHCQLIWPPHIKVVELKPVVHYIPQCNELLSTPPSWGKSWFQMDLPSMTYNQYIRTVS